MIPSRKSTLVVTSALAPSKSDYLLWNLSMYARKRTRKGKRMRREGKEVGRKEDGDGDGVQMDIPLSSVADAAHALSKKAL
ncbi:hypothetical protein CPC08DRAFT_205159 [Agrocybe pediades]|nr:hypothetical protein CPC08DRAFT_205159 [Agrocybe pediades]